MTRRSRSVLTWVTVLALLSGAAACGLDPPSGVRVDRKVVGALDDEPDVRRLPSGPQAGATPAQILPGFLEAGGGPPGPGAPPAPNFLGPGAPGGAPPGAARSAPPPPPRGPGPPRGRARDRPAA